MLEEMVIFREFKKTDYYTYSDVLNLPDGQKPKIYTHEVDDHCCVDFILSGDGAGSTLISMIFDDCQAMVSFPGFNMCHQAIAKSMVDYFKDYEIASEAVEAIVSDFEMIKVGG